MHNAIDQRPRSPLGTLTIRSQHNPYNSLPGTPLGYNPRHLSNLDIGPSLEHARSMIQPNADYFSSPGARYSTNMRPASPFPGVPSYESDLGFPGAPYSTPEDSLANYINRCAQS